MIYTNATKMALKLCFEAHKEQTDQSGIPYVFHPFHLAEQMTDEDSTIVALLHDVIEDTDYTLDDLKSMGFSQRVLDALALLTHAPDTPYEDYLRAIKTNELAKTVKIADIKHNSDSSRLEPNDPRIEYWQKKYSRAMEIVTEE